MGDWQLLAVKLALEEWRHWLEGAELEGEELKLHPIRKASQLSPGQVAVIFWSF